MTDLQKIDSYISFLREWEADEMRNARNDEHRAAIGRSFEAQIYAAEMRRNEAENAQTRRP